MKKPKLAILQHHSAPYRDQIFKKVYERGNINISVLTMSEIDFGHPYRPKNVLPYPNQFLGKIFNFKNIGRFNPGLFKHLYLTKYDVYLSHTGSLSGLMVIFYALATKKALIWSNDSVLFSPAGNDIFIRKKIRQYIFKQLINKINAFWVPGNATEEYLKQYNISSSKIFHGAYCLDIKYILKLFESAQFRRKDIRAKLGIDDSQWLFLFVGRMLSFRGIIYLVEAFHLLKQQIQNAKLLLIGDGPDKHDLAAECRRLGLTEIIFMDPIPLNELTEFYAAADSYITSALGEHYSLALAQAAICGLPIISTDRVGAIKDYLKDGETGFIVPAGDSQALALAMARMIFSKKLATEMGEKAAALAKLRTITWAAEQLEAAVFKAITPTR